MDVPWPFQAKQRLFGKWTRFLKFSFPGLWDLKILHLLSHVDKSRNEKYSKGRQWSSTIPVPWPLNEENCTATKKPKEVSEDILVSFGGYNGRYNSEVNVLKPSHKSTLQSKMIETPVPDTTNATRDVESEFDAGQEGKIREIVVDNVESEPVKSTHLVATLKAEKEELESSLSKEKMHSLQLKQELSDAENRNTEVYKELQSVRGQLAAEQSRCFKLEVDVAELRQKLQTMEALQKELELLQRQKAASEQAALNAKQKQGSGGVWGWLAGSPSDQKADDA